LVFFSKRGRVMKSYSRIFGMFYYKIYYIMLIPGWGVGQLYYRM